MGPNPMTRGFYQKRKLTQGHIGEKAMEAEMEVRHLKAKAH